MKVNWLKSISVRISSGMFIILLSLLLISAFSFLTINQFDQLSRSVSSTLLPELNKSSDLNVAVKKVHRQMIELAHVTSKIENKILNQTITIELEHIRDEINSLSQERQKGSMMLLINELIPIVSLYSEEIDRFLTSKKAITNKISQLDAVFLQHTKKHTATQAQAGESTFNELYILARSLPDHSTNFILKQKTDRIKKLIKQLKQQKLDLNIAAIIYDPAKKEGIVDNLIMAKKIQADLSALNTQTSVIVDQLNLAVQHKFSITQKRVEQQTKKLQETATNYEYTLMVTAFFATLFTVIITYIFHRSVSSRLVLIAQSIGAKNNKISLLKGIHGHSEISIIAQAILKYLAKNEQQKNEINNNNKQLQLIIENLNQAVIIYSNDKIVYCNEYCNELLDLNALTRTEVICRDLLVAINTMIYKDRLKIGNYIFRFFATEIDWDGKTSTLALLTDITGEVQNEEKLLKSLEVVTDESLTDTLTGLYNRRKLDLFQADQAQYALIIADIDWFKLYNDHYGHSEGDACLVKTASIIQQSLRTQGDIAVRYGGEEFLILLPNSDLNQAINVAKRVQNLIEGSAILHEKSILNRISLSMGIAHSSELPTNRQNWQDVFEIADKRLYEAKAAGRNCIKHAVEEPISPNLYTR